MKAGPLIEELRHSRDFQDQICHVERLPRRPAETAELNTPLPEVLRTALQAQGIRKLYRHQAEAIEHARAGRSTVIVTSTASGKTLCYLLPMMEACLQDPSATALLIYPTKALAQDQLRVIQKYGALDPALNFLSGTYDGDTPAEMRRRLRQEARFVLTNPDMLHQGILPNHHLWDHFFHRLRFVVVDEIHSYRGVFGSNVANLFRRLNRIAAFHGSCPVFISSSATIANPGEHASRLTERATELVDRDGSPRGEKRFVLWNPPLIDLGMAERRSPITDAHRLMVKLVQDRVQSIAFTRTRLGAEVIARYCQESLQRFGPALARSVCAYRSGYLPEERRAIERRLAEGDLLGVASTNALELGIDIGSLDAGILVGYPGSIASTWQQAGRAGRGKEDSVVFLIAQNSPIDQFLMKHRDYLFEHSPEHAIIDPDNPHLVLNHLRCALRELPLEPGEIGIFGPFTAALLALLQDSSRAARSQERWYSSEDGFPAAEFSLRQSDPVTYTIMDVTDKQQKVIGTMDQTSAYSQVHDHAVYLHAGETYFVQRLDTDKKIAFVERQGVDYYTQAVAESLIRIDETEESAHWRKSVKSFGAVTVHNLVTMFKKIKFHTRESLGYENLQLPRETLETIAFWLLPAAAAMDRCRQFGLTPLEGMVGISNLLLEVAPLFVMGDPQDLGAVVEASNLGSPTLFFYDKFVGGVGYSEKVYQLLEEILQACLAIVKECACQAGCPSCVGTLHPGSVQQPGLCEEPRDRIPSKEATLVLLHELLEIPGYRPRRPEEPSESPAESAASLHPTVCQQKLPPLLEGRLRRRIRKTDKAGPEGAGERRKEEP